ncbi:hypothetical protein ACRRTK_000118 [Alexandromys fortis]
MAGERTRRFTRSLLRPGQAAELRHSAASAAAVAVSNRQLQRSRIHLLLITHNSVCGLETNLVFGELDMLTYIE